MQDGIPPFSFSRVTLNAAFVFNSLPENAESCWENPNTKRKSWIVPMKWSENFLIRKTIKLLHALETWHFLDLGEVCISLCKIVTLRAAWNPSTASLPCNCLSSMLNYSYFINNEFLQWMLMPKKVNQQIEVRVHSTLMYSNVNTPKDII